MRALLKMVTVAIVMLPAESFSWQADGLVRPLDSRQSLSLQIAYPDDNAPLLGEGIDLITGERKAARCIDHGGSARIDLNNRVATFDEVIDDYSLWTKSNVSITAKAKYAGWGGGASYTSTVETKTSTKKISTVLKASAVNYAMVLTPSTSSGERADGISERIDLTSSARRLMAYNPRRFRQVCGDGFVAQISYGGDFYGTLDFSNLTYEQRRSLTMSIDAAGPGDVFNLSGKSEFSSALNTVNDRTSIRLQESGTDPAAAPVDRAELKANYQSFWARATDHERPLFILVKTYESLPNGENTAFIAYRNTLEKLIQTSLRYKSLLRDIQSAWAERTDPRVPVANRTFFSIEAIEAPSRNTNGMRAARDELLNGLQRIAEAIDDCFSAAGSATPASNVSSGAILGGPYKEEAKREATQREKPTCQYPTDNLLQSDMAYRARMPVPKNVISKDAYDALVNLVNGGGDFRKVAICRTAEIILQEQVTRVADVRCAVDGECLQSDALNTLRNIVVDSIIGAQQCPIAKANFVGSLNSELAYPLVEAGHPFEKSLQITKSSRSVSELVGENLWDLDPSLRPGNQ